MPLLGHCQKIKRRQSPQSFLPFSIVAQPLLYRKDEVYMKYILVPFLMATVLISTSAMAAEKRCQSSKASMKAAHAQTVQALAEGRIGAAEYISISVRQNAAVDLACDPITHIEACDQYRHDLNLAAYQTSVALGEGRISRLHADEINAEQEIARAQTDVYCNGQ
jgi:hypothetical protein